MNPLDLQYPFIGRWLVQNSPANRVPSHGTAAFASSYAIDFLPVDDRGRTAPILLATWVHPESPTRFPGFGRDVLAPADGVVVALDDHQNDHDAHRGLRSLAYALSQVRRAAAGWSALAGNYVLIRTDEGPYVALCHLRRGSVTVAISGRVKAGERVGACGNSGNSTEPHLHVQAIDHHDPTKAKAVPITFDGHLPTNGALTHP